MAALPVGGLKSLTLENTMLEVAQLLQTAEQTATPPQTRLTLNINTDANVASISVNLPIAPIISSSGALTITATEYA